MDRQLEEYRRNFERIEEAIGRVVKGQERPKHLVTVAAYAGGHVLFEGVPGVAKTLLLRTLAKTIDGGFARIQGNPDLRPSDIIGKREQDDTGKWPWVPGPLLAEKNGKKPNVILFDEINRAQTKTQSAFLEPMQERQVTIGSDTYVLPSFLMFVATRNPVERNETWELPAAQRDRFMFETEVGYPSRKDELAVARDPSYRDMSKKVESITMPIVTPDEILAARTAVEAGVKVGGAVEDYIMDLVEATRDPQRFNIHEIPYVDRGETKKIPVEKVLDVGSSPRGTTDLIQASKFIAWLRNRENVHPEDVRSIMNDVLMHRVFFKTGGTARRSAVARSFMEAVLKTVSAR